MEAALELARDLIRMASPSQRESPAGDVFQEALSQLGFDKTYRDRAGNVVGVFDRGPGPTVMLNGHLDTVPVGDEHLWPYPPLSGMVADGRLWGRGACDMKGPLAAMAVAASEAAATGFQGRLLVSGVVQEELGGLGARFLTQDIRPDVVILGEPSGLSLKVGHRGRIEFHVTLPGRIAHAAKASLGENALYRAATFLRDLEHIELPVGGPLGSSSAIPTQLVTVPKDGANVVPGAALLTIDYRNLPEDGVERATSLLALLDPGATISVPEMVFESESKDVSMTFPKLNPPYLLAHDHPALEVARTSLKASSDRAGLPFREGVWWFATDAPHLAQSGAAILGFGPGEEELAHTTNESIPVDQLSAAVAAYRDLALALLRDLR